jgi:hypothetical protein
MKTPADDKAADDGEVHQRLASAHIKPVIQNRSLWKDDFERMLPGHDGSSNVVYDESGTVYCCDKVSDPPVRHRMAWARSRGRWRRREKHRTGRTPCVRPRHGPADPLRRGGCLSTPAQRDSRNTPSRPKQSLHRPLRLA